MIERRPITSRAEWLEWRKRDLTASAVPALFDAFPPTYKMTALRLYVEKRGVEFPDADSKVMRRGRWLEPAVAEAVRELRPQWRIFPALTYFRDPELRLGATPDFFIEDDVSGLGVLQAKTVAPSVWHRDWDSGRDPPLHVRLQVAVELMLSGASWGAIACLVVDAFNMDVEIVEVARHADVENRIIAAVHQFWRDVETGNEPQPDYRKDAELIAQLSPHATPGLTVDATGNNELPDLLIRRADLRAAIKIADDECATIEANIKHLMADAESIVGLPDWRISYRNQPRKQYTVPAGNPRVLHIYDRRPEEEEQT